jgi:putative endonuclease
MGGWAYMLECADQSYYVGSTSHEDLRVAEHNDARFIGCTSTRRPVFLVWSEWFHDLKEAHEMERRVKGWSRAKKRALIVGDTEQLVQLPRRRAGKPRPARQPSKHALSFNLSPSRHPEVRAQRASKDEK